MKTTPLKWAAVWAVGGYCYDVLYRTKKAEKEAVAYARSVGKPVLNVGSGTRGSNIASVLVGPSRVGDVNLDLAGKTLCPTTKQLREAFGGPPACQGDAHDLSQYPDKTFGSVVACHILEHLDDPAKALAEWQRVGDRVFVVVPRWWWMHAWWGFDPSQPLSPAHKWVFVGGKGYPLWQPPQVG